MSLKFSAMSARLKYISLIVLALSVICQSCDSFFDVEVDEAQVVNERVFSDDKSAESAIIGLYQTMVSSSFAGGGSTGITVLSGLSADELRIVELSQEYLVFQKNDLRADNAYILSLWSEAYRIIYQANDILEELDKTNTINATLKAQLRGEALFVRAFCHFYLANIFGDVPLVTTADYHINYNLRRTSRDDVYAAVAQDLVNSKMLLPEDYAKIDRVRPIQAAAAALLARVSLYREKWDDAINYSSEVINDSKFRIEQDINSVFLKTSPETIWQLASEAQNNTRDGGALAIRYGVGTSTVELSTEQLESFEENDLRKQNWISNYAVTEFGQILFFPFKYKAEYYSPNVEHFVVLRLAEQYLIRAEANTMSNNFSEAIDDLDEVRFRAGVAVIERTDDLMNREKLMPLVVRERRSELFAEWGHRWFDLGRWEISSDVLSPIKPRWTDEDSVYPIPSSEIKLNPNLGDD